MFTLFGGGVPPAAGLPIGRFGVNGQVKPELIQACGADLAEYRAGRGHSLGGARAVPVMGWLLSWQSQDDEFDASISCAPIGGVVGVDGFVRPIANGIEPAGRDTPVDEILHHRIGAILGQL